MICEYNKPCFDELVRENLLKNIVLLNHISIHFSWCCLMLWSHMPWIYIYIYIYSAYICDLRHKFFTQLTNLSYLNQVVHFFLQNVSFSCSVNCLWLYIWCFFCLASDIWYSVGYALEETEVEEKEPAKVTQNNNKLEYRKQGVISGFKVASNPDYNVER